MRILSLSGALALCLAALSGCKLEPAASRDGGTGCEGTCRETIADFPATPNRDLDVLFVVDNSGSMAEEQASLASNFQSFMTVLADSEGGLPGLHVGVVSSNVGVGGYQITGCGGQGDYGRLQNTPRYACQPPLGFFISDVLNADGTRTQNYTGTLADTFSCIAKLGTDGCGFEQHLESMKLALDGSNMQNQGFLRQSAYLAVIFLADEDDCSAKPDGTTIFDPANDDLTGPLGPLSSFRCTEFGIECDGAPISRAAADYSPPGVCEPRSDSPYLQHPQDYVDFLRSLKDDPNLIITAGIIGNPTPVGVAVDPVSQEPELKPSCQTAGTGEAAPGVRLDWFLKQFPDRNTEASICQSDLSDALTQIAHLLARVVGNRCLQASFPKDDAGNLVDVDPNNPGVQLDCDVSGVLYPNTEQEQETPIPRCDMQDENTPILPPDGTPCWWTDLDTVSCVDTVDHLALYVEPQNRSLPTSSRVVVRCLVQR